MVKKELDTTPDQIGETIKRRADSSDSVLGRFCSSRFLEVLSGNGLSLSCFWFGLVPFQEAAPQCATWGLQVGGHATLKSTILQLVSKLHTCIRARTHTPEHTSI